MMTAKMRVRVTNTAKWSHTTDEPKLFFHTQSAVLEWEPSGRYSP
jgi:hypothetical protein